jgi:hypothetical protein
VKVKHPVNANRSFAEGDGLHGFCSVIGITATKVYFLLDLRHWEGVMSFKENLLKKIRIDELAKKVLDSIGPPDSGLKLDKDAMRSLLEMSPYQYQKERDLDLYIKKDDPEKSTILVLDNELPIYRTTVEDVAIRKSPYIKEMASIRNIIKILKDADVKTSIKADSVKTVQKECIGLLDLSFNASDIEAIAREGRDSLQNGYAEGIKESLILLADLLDYRTPPPPFQIRHHEIFGKLLQKEGGEALYGPMVLHSLIDNSTKLITRPISSFDKAQMEFFQQVIQGNQKADMEGSDVFHYLKEAVVNKS